MIETAVAVTDALRCAHSALGCAECEVQAEANLVPGVNRKCAGAVGITVYRVGHGKRSVAPGLHQVGTRGPLEVLQSPGAGPAHFQHSHGARLHTG